MTHTSILIVDDEQDQRIQIRRWLEDEGYIVDEVTNGEEALKKLEIKTFKVVLLDIMLPGMDGFQILDRINEDFPDSSVIIITGYGSSEVLKRAFKEGTCEYIEKPINYEELLVRIRKVIEQSDIIYEAKYLREELKQQYQFENIIGKSIQMQRIFNLVRKVAPTDTTVLIQGGSGTGKELIARAIHYNSPRKNRPFVTVNCPSIPENLIESELFGHIRGAFTGANRDRKGKFQIANLSTIFLDEIGDLKEDLQAKLLRVLQEKEIERVGESRPINIDVRVIAATNKNIEELMKEGRFREDLYYRLNRFTIKIPPLRERKEDIPLLINHFIEKHGKGKKYTINEDTLKTLNEYDWPGNVRELENIIERAIILEEGDTLFVKDLPANLLNSVSKLNIDFSELEFNAAKDMFEKQYVLEVLEKTDWNISHAAKMAGMDRRNFKDKMKKYEIKKMR